MNTASTEPYSHDEKCLSKHFFSYTDHVNMYELGTEPVLPLV